MSLCCRRATIVLYMSTGTQVIHMLSTSKFIISPSYLDHISWSSICRMWPTSSLPPSMPATNSSLAAKTWLNRDEVCSSTDFKWLGARFGAGCIKSHVGKGIQDWNFDAKCPRQVGVKGVSAGAKKHMWLFRNYLCPWSESTPHTGTIFTVLLDTLNKIGSKIISLTTEPSNRWLEFSVSHVNVTGVSTHRLSRRSLTLCSINAASSAETLPTFTSAAWDKALGGFCQILLFVSLLFQFQCCDQQLVHSMRPKVNTPGGLFFPGQYSDLPRLESSRHQTWPALIHISASSFWSKAWSAPACFWNCSCLTSTQTCWMCGSMWRMYW